MNLKGFLFRFCDSNNSFDPFINFSIRRILLLSTNFLNKIQRLEDFEGQNIVRSKQRL